MNLATSANDHMITAYVNHAFVSKASTAHQVQRMYAIARTMDNDIRKYVLKCMRAWNYYADISVVISNARMARGSWHCKLAFKDNTIMALWDIAMVAQAINYARITIRPMQA